MKKSDDGRIIEQDLRKEVVGFWLACVFMTGAVLVPALLR